MAKGRNESVLCLLDCGVSSEMQDAEGGIERVGGAPAPSAEASVTGPEVLGSHVVGSD